jgi:hypothetical protein
MYSHSFIDEEGMCEEGGEVVVWWIEGLSVEGEGRRWRCCIL